MFAVVLVSAASDTTARVVLAFLAVLTLALGGYSLFWMIRGLLSDPGPLVIGQDGLALTLQGQLYVPWSEVVACRMHRDGSVLVDLASPISHVAESGWMRRLARGRTLVISNRFFDMSGERLDGLIQGRIAAG